VPAPSVACGQRAPRETGRLTYGKADVTPLTTTSAFRRRRRVRLLCAATCGGSAQKARGQIYDRTHCVI
jgi:hypothetical protein